MSLDLSAVAPEVEQEDPRESLPCIRLYWDAKTQQPSVDFKNTEFLTWTFVKAVLSMGMDWAENMDRIATAAKFQQAHQASIQQEMAAMQQAAAIEKSKRNGLRH